jgi:hypothetical protein
MSYFVTANFPAIIVKHIGEYLFHILLNHCLTLSNAILKTLRISTANPCPESMIFWYRSECGSGSSESNPHL